ncbi:MAG: virulence factor [Rhodospirillales bacterium]|nr:virulence factor [Rhodospirillales bacterium]MBO6786043.1 virulence factor [Rhodospirillales bacterium]
MAQATIVYWRDIPAQVIVKQGRQTAKRELAPRFQEAIDLAAMRAKAIGTDAYLADWRRDGGIECGDDLETEADAWQARLEAEYDDARIKSLVDGKGFEP